MSDDDLLYFGVVVTIFLVLAAILTARELFENYLEEKDAARRAAEDHVTEN